MPDSTTPREGEITDEMREWFSALRVQEVYGKFSFRVFCDGCKEFLDTNLSESNSTIRDAWILEHYPRRAQPRPLEGDDKAAMEAENEARLQVISKFNHATWAGLEKKHKDGAVGSFLMGVCPQAIKAGWQASRDHALAAVLAIIESERKTSTYVGGHIDKRALDDVKRAIEAMRQENK